jgi:UDPglucose 6-dehydrogenase
MEPEEAVSGPVAVLGAGHVGLVTAVGFTHHGISVRLGEPDPWRRATLVAGRAPFFEPGLEPLVAEAIGSGRLSVHAHNAEAAAGATAVFIAVPTPAGPRGADLSFVEIAIRSVAGVVGEGVPVVVKSSVPPGSWRRIETLLADMECPGSLVINPEFLQEGLAVRSVMKPARVVVGSRDPAAAERVAELHAPFGAEVVTTDPASAELIKYAANSYLAMRVTFANSIANVADAVGADVMDVLEGVGLDPRIGRHFLHPGPGYGGSCFPKDLPALVSAAAEHGVDLDLITAVVEANAAQVGRVVAKVEEAAGGLSGKTIGLLGLAFKANTDDTRNSPAVAVARRLIEGGALVRAYDPTARAPDGEIQQVARALDAITGADLVVIATEWPEFAELDPGALREAMVGNVVVDVRNLLDKEAALAAGLDYRGMGR